MKVHEQVPVSAATQTTFADACLAECKKLLGRIEKAKAAILAEFRETLQAHDHMLQLAVTEAEALAWQTDYPHLVFPTLALEKAEAVSAWQRRQNAIRQTRPALAFAE
jgi:hypothetical protein